MWNFKSFLTALHCEETGRTQDADSTLRTEVTSHPGSHAISMNVGALSASYTPGAVRSFAYPHRQFSLFWSSSYATKAGYNIKYTGWLGSHKLKHYGEVLFMTEATVNNGI